MTQALERAFAEANKLDDQAQDALAALILTELESERLWDEAFARSQDQLAGLADQALAEYRAGRTEALTEPKMTF